MEWWKEGILYQIYPKSFKDSTGNGVGDLPGIISQVDYLDYLGIDMVWLSPIFASPDFDNGYDISNYRKIKPEFGDMADFHTLMEELHRRDIRLILDMVVNHTSSQHKWFQKSRENSRGPFADFYHWETDKPNDWESFFGGPTWSFDEAREEYYLHLFHEEQPDLNWENPRVRQEVYEIMKFWLDKGVDGFRLDVINLLSKAEGYPEGEKKSSGYTDGSPYFVNGPKLTDYLKEMNQEVFKNYDMVKIGEVIGGEPQYYKSLIADTEKALDLLIHFDHVSLDQRKDKWTGKEFSLVSFKQVIEKWLRTLAPEGWNAFYLENHDQPRSVERFAKGGKYRERSAKMLATMLLTLPVTPFIYQGQEIGMTNLNFTDISEVVDVESRNFYNSFIENGGDPQEALELISTRGRDNGRSPMQWNSSRGAGFTSGTPWLKLNDNYQEVNVDQEKEKENSVLQYYRDLISFRKNNPALIRGYFMQSAADDEDIFAYWRKGKDRTFLVVLNFSNTIQVFLDDHYSKNLEFIMSNVMVKEDHASDKIPPLAPYEARIYSQH